jgi:hypothetical protein
MTKEMQYCLLPRTCWKDRDTFLKADYTRSFSGPLTELGISIARVPEFLDTIARNLSEALEPEMEFSLRLQAPRRETNAVKRERKLERANKQWRRRLKDLKRAQESEFEVVILEARREHNTLQEVEIASFAVRAYDPPNEDFI